MSDENLKQFNDILNPDIRKSFFKKWELTKLYQRDKYLTPNELKLKVLESPRINKLIEEMSNDDSDEKELLTKSVTDILNEIGLDESIFVYRCMGSLTSFLVKSLYNSAYINEGSIQRVKNVANKQPILFLPSHRSYGDFVLISFLCYMYDIEIPAIAAGMDFHAMVIMGSALRKTGAFFMRRKFSQDKFYWHIFKEYIHKLITSYHKAVEFFIEGTRSRSFKSLTPKIGLLSMALEPLFMGEVSDITIVPLSISYDKPVEEELFVYELLGIPKPKETTLGLLKSLNLMEKNYGSVHFEFGKPISAREYFGIKMDRKIHSNEPAYVQTLNKDEKILINNLAYEVLHQQQNKIVILPFNLITYYFTYRNYIGLTTDMNELIEGVLILKNILSSVNAIVALDNNKDIIRNQIEESLKTHANALKFNENSGLLELIKLNINLINIDKKKLKGHNLSEPIMNISVPIFTTQLYNNVLLHWLAQPALMILATIKLKSKNNHGIDINDLKKEVHILRDIFSQEFVFHTEQEEMEFTNGYDLLIRLNIFTKQSTINTINVDQTNKFTNLLMSSVAPYICCYYQTSNTILMQFTDKKFTEKDYLVKVQECVEKKVMEQEEFVHPYCLSLDTLNLSLLSYFLLQNVIKTEDDGAVFYTVNEEKMNSTKMLLKQYCQLLPFKFVQ